MSLPTPKLCYDIVRIIILPLSLVPDRTPFRELSMPLSIYSIVTTHRQTFHVASSRHMPLHRIIFRTICSLYRLSRNISLQLLFYEHIFQSDSRCKFSVQCINVRAMKLKVSRVNNFLLYNFIVNNSIFLYNKIHICFNTYIIIFLFRTNYFNHNSFLVSFCRKRIFIIEVSIVSDTKGWCGYDMKGTFVHVQCALILNYKK